jgi:hypothetical protein
LRFRLTNNNITATEPGLKKDAFRPPGKNRVATISKSPPGIWRFPLPNYDMEKGGLSAAFPALT